MALLCVVGPTAAGKTALAIALARAAGGEVLSCDALQIRRGLPVLTSKPTREELALAPHHLVGVLPLAVSANAARYTELAEEALLGAARRATRLIVCGGTGLYLRALGQGLFAGPAADADFRAALRAESAAIGVPALHRRLGEVDPEAAARIEPADYVRIERALEVHALSGRPISQWQAEGRARGPRRALRIIGLDPGKEALLSRITARAEAMIDAGVADEVAQVEAVFRDGLSQPPIGYGSVGRYLRGELNRQALRDALAAETAQYARRQRTWFRKEPGVRWYTDAAEVPINELLRENEKESA